MAPTPNSAEPLRRRGYVICTTQRTGSNYLCQVLASTGILGRPLDYFNTQGRRAKGWPDYPDDRERQLDIIVNQGATDNGVYGLKLFAYDFDALAALPWTTWLPDLHWIFLHREDLLGQAISLTLAKQTGQWRSSGESGGTSRYDAEAIDHELADIARDNADWRSYFARNGLEPLLLRYEDLVAAPETAVESVARLLAIEGAPLIDRSQIDVGIQRDAVSREWRARYLAERQDLAAFRAAATTAAPVAAGPIWYPAIRKARPKLTVSIVTRNAEARLARLLAEAAGYADEILVGVDASSTDGTLEVAAQHADTVYRFSLARPGQLAPVRMLALNYAKGDWILSLDDDEGMEPSFEALLPKLMAAEGVTHHHFPRKWVISETPPMFLYDAPWYPNWSRRMFRNDRSLVWKPSLPHSQHSVQGPGSYEYGTSILHFEPVMASADERRRKIEAYRGAGAVDGSERFYDYSPSARRKPVTLRQPTPLGSPRAAVVDRTVHELAATATPWCSIVLGTDLPKVVRAGEPLLVEVRVRNTGTLAWSPSYAQWPTREWPLIRLSYHLLQADGTALWREGGRTRLSRYVAPGCEVSFMVEEFVVPAVRGRYIVEWDMLNEDECWFASCGGTVLRDGIEVV
jgi:LPS sulfotransferase NodH